MQCARRRMKLIYEESISSTFYCSLRQVEAHNLFPSIQSVLWAFVPLNSLMYYSDTLAIYSVHVRKERQSL